MVQSNRTSAEICSGLQPGRTYIFILKTKKGNQISDDVKLLHTVKPKIPENLKILTDYEKRKFRYYFFHFSHNFSINFNLLTLFSVINH